jgi:hypothetical protein
MTQYLTADHLPAPQTVTTPDMMVHPTALAIEQGQTAYLATLGIFPHQHPDEPAPLGIDWELVNGTYIGTPAGNEADRVAALAAQEMLRLRRDVWPQQYKQRRVREANDVLADPDSTPNQRIEALQTLNTL